MVIHANYFEAIMLICFGLAWPVSIYKLLKSKTAKGKSIYFLFIILTGYIAGILFEIFGARDNVIYLYFLNTAIVVIDIIITIYYSKQDRRRDQLQADAATS